MIRSLFKFGLPTGVQGIAMNVGGVMLLRFIGGLEHSAAAQAAYTIGYTELFSMITWTSVGLMGAAATIAGQNLGAGKPDRALHGVFAAAKIGLMVAAIVGAMFLLIPTPLLGIFGATEGDVADIGRQLLRYLALSGFFISGALTFTGGLQGTGDTKSPLVITLVSQIAIPLGPLRRAAEHAAAAASGHLARHRARPLHALRPLVPEVPAGQVARDQGGVGARQAGAAGVKSPRRLLPAASHCVRDRLTWRRPRARLAAASAFATRTISWSAS